jgi:hypothetical protein
MEWRIILASLLLLTLTAIVLYMAYTIIPAVRDLSQPDDVNVTYSATGLLVRAPTGAVDASGNVWRWTY